MSILLRLLFAHIISDFFLQTKRMANGKRQGSKTRWFILTIHCLIHAAVAYFLVGKWEMWYIPVILFTTHFIIDNIKTSFHGNSISAFLFDQVAHLFVIAVLWISIMPQSLYDMIDTATEHLPDNIWTIAIAYALILRPASILMSLLLKRWQLSNMVDSSLPDAGKWIGYLERIMILTFIITNNMENVGFLLAAKSVFRFGDLNKAKDIKATEYVIIGTMISFAFAIIVGLLISEKP